jgi:hypothetical protein
MSPNLLPKTAIGLSRQFVAPRISVANAQPNDPASKVEGLG